MWRLDVETSGSIIYKILGTAGIDAFQNIPQLIFAVMTKD
jgi:hypothetical protein